MSWVDRIEAAVATTSCSEVTAPHPLEGSHRLVTTEDRIRFMTLVRQVVKADVATDADLFADLLVEILLSGRTADTVEVLDRKLSWDDIRSLEADSLFTIGGHGRTHRILGYLERSEMRSEVQTCLSQLRTLGNCPAYHFSYPEGFAGSFSEDLISELSQHGVRTGVTTVPGGNAGGANPMILQRFFVA
jgi:hypothetical protein